MTQPFVGYQGAIWSKTLASVNYLSQALSDAPTLASTIATAESVFNTILDGLQALNAARMQAAWTAELNNLHAIQALPLSLPVATAAILNNRVTAYSAAVDAVSGYVPLPPFPLVAPSISQGMPVIPNPDLLSFYKNFDYETSPAGLTADNFIATATSIATAFSDIATAIQILQGQYLTQTYDTATRQAATALAAANILADFTSGPITPPSSLSATWNQMVTLPAFTMTANILASAPYLLAIQQNSVIRYTMLQMAGQLAVFLIVLRNPRATQVNLATVANNDTLMDVAARNMGDFEQWQAIAELNNLSPPWTAAIASSGVAAFGSQLFLPTAGASKSTIGTPPNYFTNFLGIDVYLGPLNQPMLPWRGDFQLISGYQNLAISLGRRLQTTLGTLLYHSDFGSRIPPEVGRIQTQSTAGQIAAFGKSALLSDPRVSSVSDASATLGPNGSVGFQGLVQPAGFSGNAVSVNEVLQPL